MSISRGICAVLVAATLSTAAQAGIVGTVALQKEPAGNPFAAPDAALPAPWVSYTLGLQGNAGEVIAAVDVTIKGQLHQRWTFDADLESFVPTPNNNVNITNGDSKLRAVTGAIFGAGPFEDNPGTGSPLADTGTADYGVGTTLSGAWGIPVANQGSQVNLAYIVIPKGSEVSTEISVKIAGQDGGILAELGASAFPGFGAVVGVAPVVVDFLDQDDTVNKLVSTTIATSAGDAPITWSDLTNFSYTPGFGAVPNPSGIGIQPVWNPATQSFSWDTTNSSRGTYSWDVVATNAAGSDTGSITVEVRSVPEPASLALVGLALVGLVGCRRK